VNIVETRHKVFPVLGEASSLSKYVYHAVTLILRTSVGCR